MISGAAKLNSFKLHANEEDCRDASPAYFVKTIFFIAVNLEVSRR